MTKLTPETERDAVMITDAYVTLLLLPHSSPTRLRVQSVMASLRDELAHLTGSQPETVQNLCEAIADGQLQRNRERKQ